MITRLFLFLFIIPLSHFFSYGQVSEFNQQEFGSQIHCSGYRINLTPGYSYKPSGSERMHSYISTICEANSYVELSKKIGGELYRIVNDKIYIKYREEYNEATFKFNIYDDSNSLVADNQSLTVNAFDGYGDNRLEISLQGAGVNFSLGYYILEIINKKNEKWYLRFKY